MNFEGKKRGLFGVLIGLILVFAAPVLPIPALQYGVMITGLAVLVYAGVIIWKKWRCPHCKALMPVRGIYQSEYCHQCGKRIG